MNAVAELTRAASDVPDGWASCELGSLFAASAPGHWGDEPIDGGNILVLRSTNFKKAGGLDYSTAAPRQFDERKLVQKRLAPGDIILERSGGSPAQPVGRARRFDKEGLYSASNFMQILKPSKACGQLGDSLFRADRIQDWRRERHLGSTRIKRRAVGAGPSVSSW